MLCLPGSWGVASDPTALHAQGSSTWSHPQGFGQRPYGPLKARLCPSLFWNEGSSLNDLWIVVRVILCLEDTTSSAPDSSMILSCKNTKVWQPSFIPSCLLPLQFKLTVSHWGGWLSPWFTCISIYLSNTCFATLGAFPSEQDLFFAIWVAWEVFKSFSSVFCLTIPSLSHFSLLAFYHKQSEAKMYLQHFA